MLDSNQRVAAMLHTGDSSVHPALKSQPVLQQHSTGTKQQAAPSALHTGDSGVHPTLVSQQQTYHPKPAVHQTPSSAMHTGDSHAQAVLSSSTPDRVEEARVAHHSSPSSNFDSERDGAEQGSVLGPPPTGPPSTVSRSGRVVYRAAKVGANQSWR